MKLLKKSITLITAAALASSLVAPLRADAAYGFVSDPFSAPDGYEFFNAEGMFDYMVMPGSVFGTETEVPFYTVCRKRSEDSGETYYHLYFDYKYNYTSFSIKNEKIEEFDAIYEKYSDGLDMDYYKRENPPLAQPDFDVTATMYDKYDETGELIKDPAHAVSKFINVLAFMSEAYRAGCLNDADYYGVTCGTMLGFERSFGIYLRDGDAETDKTAELQAIVDSFGAEVVAYEGSVASDGEYHRQYGINMEDDWDIPEILAAVREVYPDVVGVNAAIFDMSSGTANAGAVNIITGSEYSYCDTDGNGKVELDDAVTVLQHYAQTAVGISADETASLTADSNGDGSVNLDDAVMVLTSYAETAAGIEN